MGLKLLTFKSLQTIIGEVNEIATPDGVVYNIIRPLFVMSQPTQQGNQMVFIPFMEWSQEWEKGIDFNKTEFITENTPLDEVAEEYRKLFSNIQIASSMPKFKDK